MTEYLNLRYSKEEWAALEIARVGRDHPINDADLVRACIRFAGRDPRFQLFLDEAGL